MIFFLFTLLIERIAQHERPAPFRVAASLPAGARFCVMPPVDLGIFTGVQAMPG